MSQTVRVAVTCTQLLTVTCKSPTTCTVTYGPHSFAACAPNLWNSLPTTLQHYVLTMTQFCSQLKTHLFGLAYGSAS